MIYDVGDAARLRHEVRVDGTLTAATVALTVTAPDGTTSTPSVSTPSTGVYLANVPVNQVGTWAYVFTVSGTVVDVAPGAFTAADPAPPAYVSLALFKANLKLETTDRDELLAQALVAASRSIDNVTGRRFYLDRAATARVYNPRGRTTRTGLLLVDDIGSAADLAVEVGSGGSYGQVDAAAYETGPDNALARREPITALQRLAGGWAGGTQRIRITARWGWPAVPDEVVQATLIQAARLYRRKDSPEGILGNAEWGTVRLSRIDPDVQALIGHLILPGFA